jgi:protein SCO1
MSHYLVMAAEFCRRLRFVRDRDSGRVGAFSLASVFSIRRRQCSGHGTTASRGAFLGLLTILVAGGTLAAHGQDQNSAPALLRNVGIDQKLDEQLPLELTFQNETGQTVALKRYFDQKPVILSLVYYECPMLCTQELNGLLASLKELSFDVGKQFAVVTVSFNPHEKPALAAAKKMMYTGLYGRSGAAEGWHFLTGNEASIERLTRAVGFRYAYDAASRQYAHATAVMVLTPSGRISRYFYGIEYPSHDLRLGLVEASAGKIGSPVDQLLLVCYHYDPKTGKYGLVISNVIRLSGLATVLALGWFLFVMFRRERRFHGVDVGSARS